MATTYGSTDIDAGNVRTAIFDAASVIVYSLAVGGKSRTNDQMLIRILTTSDGDTSASSSWQQLSGYGIQCACASMLTSCHVKRKYGDLALVRLLSSFQSLIVLASRPLVTSR